MSNKSKDADPKQPDSSFIQFDDAKQQGAASAASAPRRKALLGVLTAACTILIVVSLGFVHPSESGAWSIDWIIQTVTGESVITKDTKGSGSTTTSGEASSEGSKSSNGAKDESKGSNDGKDDSESSDKESDKKSDSKKSGDKSAAQNTGAGDTSNVSGGASTGGGQSSDGASSSNGGSAPSGGQGGSQESNYVTVTVSVTSSAVGNPVSSGGTFTFNEGATVYDALCALGLSVNAENSPLYHGVYVKAIGGLAEYEHGGTSGWCYSVNGSQPMTACSNYVLSNGDNVVWYYVTG